PARKCLLYVLMVFRFLAHSLTPFGHETAASVACEWRENILSAGAKNAQRFAPFSRGFRGMKSPEPVTVEPSTEGTLCVLAYKYIYLLKLSGDREVKKPHKGAVI
ncbi:hypothetical protein, partial [Klebsiella pneumoniae]|uniref:hypothetical protein n=1 Tax=Klebsiella pneumoniae TaxID=573 RepID=UPI001A91739C